MSGLTIEQLPVLNDNYVYLLHDGATGKCAAVDPSVAEPVLEAVERRGWHLSHILNTHHHWDHTGGNLALKQATGCTIVGYGKDASRIPGIDVEVADGEVIGFGVHHAQIIAVPGHTLGHIAYWFEAASAVFCGDTLFSLGCGRLFEGSPPMMWASLLRLRDLPDDTRVFCGHEYTLNNAAFALDVDPDNPSLQRRAAEVKELRRQGMPSVPSLLADEKAANPFLRADSPSLRSRLKSADPVAVFAEIRRRKDVF